MFLNIYDYYNNSGLSWMLPINHIWYDSSKQSAIWKMSTSPKLTTNPAFHQSTVPILSYFVGQNIPLVNLPVVLVFQPRVLADGVGIDLYASIVAENMRFASVYENNTSINPLPIIYTLASEFNLSHSFSVFITLN